MGRHVAIDDLAAVGATRRPRLGWGLWTVALVVAVVLVAAVIGVFVVGPRKAYALLPFTASPPCRPLAVEVSAAPAAAPVVQAITAPVNGTDLGQGQCLSVQVSEQDPAGTVAGSAVLPVDRAPDVWIPDSSLWVPRVTAWRLQRVSTLASSPVVLATSRQAVVALGWAGTAPTWAQAMAGRRPVALSDINQDVDSLAALLALWQSAGKDADAERVVTRAVFAASQGQLPSETTALALAQSGSAGAPLLPTSEQAIFIANNGSRDPSLVAVYPRDGSPQLDFPILRTQANTRSSAEQHGVDVVLARLTSPDARAVLVANGFRVSAGTGPNGAGVRTSSVRALALPTTAEITGLLNRAQLVSQPSRILTVIDVSTSMAAPVPGGLNRAQLAASAAVRFVDVLPDTAASGLWIFAQRLQGAQDWRVVSPVRPLGATEAGGRTHRDTLVAAAGRVPNQLSAGGTALYNTALAAVRSMQASFDPNAINAVVIFTDGANENSTGMTLAQVVSTLKAETDPRRPVLLLGIGIGPDADVASLRAMSLATTGRAVGVQTEADIQRVLLEGLTRRTP